MKKLIVCLLIVGIFAELDSAGAPKSPRRDRTPSPKRKTPEQIELDNKMVGAESILRAYDREEFKALIMSVLEDNANPSAYVMVSGLDIDQKLKEDIVAIEEIQNIFNRIVCELLEEISAARSAHDESEDEEDLDGVAHAEKIAAVEKILNSLDKQYLKNLILNGSIVSDETALQYLKLSPVLSLQQIKNPRMHNSILAFLNSVADTISPVERQNHAANKFSKIIDVIKAVRQTVRVR